jgi:Tetratricopeptide repeat
VAACPEDYPGLAMLLSDLGTALQRRFEHSGTAADLDAAIQLGQRALDACSDDHPGRAMFLSNLGAALERRFERTGAVEDLDTAIGLLRQAVAVGGDDHPGHAAFLSNLGIALHRRFWPTGAVEDLDEAIAAGRQALAASTEDYPGRAMLCSNLGIALQDRFGRTGSLDDLDEAIMAGRQAVTASTEDHFGRALFLSNLGAGLRVRFERTGALADLTEAIAFLDQAVAACPEDHPDRVMFLSNLGAALYRRFRRTGELEDLDEAVQAGRLGVAASAEDHPDRAMFLLNLGAALERRFEGSGTDADRRDALGQYKLAAQARQAAPSIRVQAAQAAAALAGLSDPGGMADLLETAVELLPAMAGRHLARDDQQHALGELGGLASDAASLALTDTSRSEPERAARALRLLEGGRAVLLSQALDTRGDLTDLRREQPELAQRFIELRDLLDPPPTPALLGEGPARAARLDRHARSNQFNAVLDQIRALPEFTSFARLPATEELLIDAAAGPVVTFNVSAYRSDALLLTTSGIINVHLPDLDIDTLISKVNAFHQALDAAGDQEQAVLHEVLAWLWDAAAQPVLNALGYHALPEAEPWPRVWWATGGLLGLLPLHAAGHHNPARPGHTVIDRVISSYTPTIRALHHARQQAAAAPAKPSPDGPRSLIVAMPATPDLPRPAPLPYALREASMLARLLPAPLTLETPNPGRCLRAPAAQRYHSLRLPRLPRPLRPLTQPSPAT